MSVATRPASLRVQDVLDDTWRTAREIAEAAAVATDDAFPILQRLCRQGFAVHRPRSQTLSGRRAEWRRR